MYLGVDVGGTKTLVAVMTEDGRVKASQKFPTPRDYPDFLKQLQQTVTDLGAEKFKAAAVALPGRIDREHGIGVRFGNLPWARVSVKRDVEKLFGCPVLIENDAKLAGLSEANLLKGHFKKVLYVTFSTGIGIALIESGTIDTSLGDRGGNSMILEYDGVLQSWESFASGKAIVARYGKRASEIEDPKIWTEISERFALGLVDLISLLDPEVVVIGGGVGTHFKKFEKPLLASLKSHETPMLSIPAIRQAKRAEEAVIYGCYDLLKTHHA